jgi:hypothetical protein
MDQSGRSWKTSNIKAQPNRENRMPLAAIGGGAALPAPAREKRRRTRNGIASLTTVCAFLALAAIPAQAASRAGAEDLAACKALSDHAAELIRAGQTVMSTRAQLRRCVRIQRAERRRAGRPADIGGGAR